MKYFTIAELCRSQTADKYGINNRCKVEHVERLTDLINNILDPLRQAYGKPIQVNSGFRSPELNAKVGGASGSQHTKGEAADITAGSREENRKLFNLIQQLGLPYDQLIDEKNFSWIHVSHRQTGNRGQILRL